MNGIVAYASYIPYYRLDRKAIGETLGASAGSGTRSVACYDEDTTSMAVEAARAAGRWSGPAREEDQRLSCASKKLTASGT
jgi:hydroxymethylglutaryl-CoA synthase